MSRRSRTLAPPVDLLRHPEQVCQLPLMDPAVQFSLLTGFSLAQAASAPVVTVDVNGWCDDHGVTASYQVDVLNRCKPLSGAGSWCGKPIEGSGTMSHDRRLIRLRERVGRSLTEVELSLHPSAGTLLLRGHLGTVGAELGFQTTAADGRLQGFVCTGLLDAERYQVETHLSCTEGPDHHLEGVLEVRGRLGPTPITGSYIMMSMGPAAGEEIMWRGEGQIGEHRHRTLVTLSIVP